MEFRRFVSYVYGYQDNIKQNNCGFVKVEVRQNIARFVLHMHLPKRSDNDYRIYGFIRREQKLEGILLGLGKSKNGSLDVRIQMPSQSLGMEEVDENNPISMEQLSGMIVKGSNHTLYGTVWDDGEINMSTFQEKTRKEPSETVPTNEEKQKEPSVSDSTKEDMPEEKNMAQEEFTESIEVKKEEPKKENATIPLEKREIQIQEYEEIVEWEGLRRNCPVIVPFETAGEYLRIEPKDIKYLPKRFWHLGRNSFLLHGYYNYRYLILGQEGEEIILGIPGVYCPMEENVAAMFGFRTFRPAMEHHKMNGRFGYWCGRI